MIHPVVSAGRAAPNCVTFLKKIGRFAITILLGHHTVQDGRWLRREDDGSETPTENPLESAWQAAKSVRVALESELGFQPYTIAVAWFPDMEEDEDILDEAEGRSTRVIFGPIDLAPALAELPRNKELQTRLSMEYIEREMDALSRSSAATAPELANPAPTVAGKPGALYVGPVETVNIYITLANGGDAGDDPSLITVQGQ